MCLHFLSKAKPSQTARSKCATILAVGIMIFSAPAFANNGNGNGNSGSNGKGGQSQDASTANSNNGNGANASSLGALNGFIHANPHALAKAAPNSRIGKVITYSGVLRTYLSCAGAESCSVTIDQVAASLASAANKPLTADVVAQVDAKLATFDPDLGTAIDGYNNAATGQTGAAGLATDIAGNAPEVY